MAKTKTRPKKAKAKKKRVITCSKCSKTGHNARTCKEGLKPKPEPKKKTKKTPTPVAKRKGAPKRERPAPTRGNESAAAPYDCPRCNQIAVLVVVKVKDNNKTYLAGKDVFTTEMRCEKCFQKPPTDLIVKWGAHPGEKVELPKEEYWRAAVLRISGVVIE
jgi:hypothetical protein